MGKPAISNSFFEPENVAVIGATKKFGFGYGIPKYLIGHGYEDRIFLINPKEKELFGKPVYPSITDVPGEVDLAIIAIPAPVVPDAIRGCLQKGVRSIILESAGFSETGEKGAAIESEIQEIIKGVDVRIIGPNCVGIMNPHNDFASCEISFDQITPGNISVVAQSGVFGNILIDWAPSQDIRLSKIISIGNRLDVDEVDVLEYLLADEQTEVIVLYMEGVKNGPRFIETLSKVTRQKPVLILKSGRTEAGKAATASHTGSMAGDDAIYDGVFSKCGAIRANSFQELFDLARIFSSQPTPEGPEVAVVTASGSLGAMTVDACVKLGLKLPMFSDESLEEVRSLAPGWMNVRNPLDVGPSGLFGPAFNAALKDPQMKSIILTPVIPDMAVKGMEETGMNMDLSMWFGDVQKIRSEWNLPVVAFTLGSTSWMKSFKDFCGDAIPIVSSIETAARSVYELYKFGQRKKQLEMTGK